MATPPRSRLGRGLSALLTTSPPEPSSELSPEAAANPPVETPLTAGPLRQLPLADIDVNPHQPRQAFDEAALAELADSIRSNGVIQPIVVRQTGDRFQLVAGERRLRAAGLAGLSDIPAVVRDIDSFTQAQWALVENIHRADLNPMERAEAYAALVDQLALTQAELAGRLGEQRSTVANYLRLMELPPAVRDAVRSGQLSFGHAKVLAGVTPAVRMADLATQCLAEHWSVRRLEEALAAEPTPPASPRGATIEPGDPAAHLREVEQQLVQHLGLRVQLQTGKCQGSGRVVIHYTSLDQFDDLLDRWGVKLTTG